MPFRLGAADHVILFIHSLAGDPEHEWKQFAELWAKDASFADWDLWGFGYTTERLASNASPSLSTVANMFYTRTFCLFSAITGVLR